MENGTISWWHQSIDNRYYALRVHDLKKSAAWLWRVLSSQIKNKMNLSILQKVFDNHENFCVPVT